MRNRVFFYEAFPEGQFFQSGDAYVFIDCFSENISLIHYKVNSLRDVRDVWNYKSLKQLQSSEANSIISIVAHILSVTSSLMHIIIAKRVEMLSVCTLVDK